MLPLVRSVSIELAERRDHFKQLRALRRELSAIDSPEGMSAAIFDLDAHILEHEDAILAACEEIARLGLVVHRISPLIVHLPGQDRGEDVVYCWSECDGATVAHRHTCCGSEDDFECTMESRFIHPGFTPAPPVLVPRPEHDPASHGGRS